MAHVGSGFVAGIIGLVVAIVVAVALFPTITSGVNSLTSGASPQLTGTAATLIGLVPLFVALAVMLIAVGFALTYLHRKGAFILDTLYQNTKWVIHLFVSNAFRLAHAVISPITATK